jgi:hypothetical protein
MELFVASEKWHIPKLSERGCFIWGCAIFRLSETIKELGAAALRFLVV